jgi:O-antigen/teichoic acid export membrane protein
LLFPEAFASIAAATALISGLVLISDFAVRSVVIQSSRSEQIRFLHSAWVFQLSHGGSVWIVLIALCALVHHSELRNLLPAASVFANPKLPLIASVLGFSVVLSGAESMSLPLNVRHLNYRPVVILNLAGKLTSVSFMLLWAWIASSVWAIVAGNLAGGLIRLILSHVWVPGPRMRLSWESDDLREIGRFGRWMIVSSFASFIGQQCDVIMLGILMPASALGLYSIAKLLASTGEGLLSQLSGALALPVFGEVLRKNPGNLRYQYYRFRLPLETAAGLLSGGLFAAGDFIVRFFYDGRYADAGLMLQILALGTLFYPFLMIETAFTASGQTHVSALSSVLKAASLIVFISTGFLRFGMLGAIAGTAMHRIIPSLVLVLLAHRRGWISFWRELRIIPAFTAGFMMGKGFLLILAKLGIQSLHQIIHL